MKNIILVEDNKIERRNISCVIEKINGCNLTGVFFNGLDAMNFLEKNDVDIVITDVQMACMDGIELSRNIRKRGLDIEIIIISGYQDFDNAKSAVGLDVVDYVMKPIINNELEEAIDKAIAKCEEKRTKKADYEQMQKQVESSKLILQEQFVRGLVINSKVSNNYISKNEELLNVNVSKDCKRVFVMKTNNIHGKRVLETLCKIMGYIGGYEMENVKFYPFMLVENEIGAIVVGDNADLIFAACIDLKNKIVDKYNLQICACLSHPSMNVRDISSQYDECKNILKEEDKWNIVVLADNSNLRDDSFAYNQKKARELIKAGNTKELIEYLLQIVHQQLEKSGAIDKNFSYIFVNLLELIMFEFGISFNDFEILSSKDIWKKLEKFDSIIDVNNFLSNLSKSVIEKINEIDNDKVKVVKRIKSIIKEHYAEHITVASIAKEVNFSRKQVHRIFTQETGLTVFEYLTDYRMEVAKKLLLENKVVDDVVFEVGYKDKKYFYEIFKEKTGMSPKQFKDQGKA